MSDVRSLLRAELSSRRIKHPHVSYSNSGLALCNVCHLHLRSDSFWEPHQRSKGHKDNLQKLQSGDIFTSNGDGPTSKKRKVESDDSDDEDEGRKKARSGQHTPFSSRDVGKEDLAEPATELMATDVADETAQEPGTPNGEELHQPSDNSLPEPDLPNTAPSETVDEDEWAAFEREVALPTHHAPSSATITAAPMSAAELAAQEESTGVQNRMRREEEVEGEKEDAARQLEDEFDQMEELEERLKRMRERREGIRRRRNTAAAAEEKLVKEVIRSEADGEAKYEESAVDAGDDIDEDDNDEEDEWDGWKFG